MFGTLIVWALVRYEFPGKRLFDAIIDIPFALPTAVAGIALTTLFAENGWLGSLLVPLGIKVAFTPLGILIALIFIGLPFVVRTVQPVLLDLDAELEEVAATLGAEPSGRSLSQSHPAGHRPGTADRALRSLSPAPSANTARSSSSPAICPNVSEIAPLLIVIRLEEFKYADATAIAVVMLLASFVLLLAINRLQRWSERRAGRL